MPDNLTTQTCRVELGPRSYDIVIGHGIMPETGERIRKLLAPSRVAIIADHNVDPIYGDEAQESLTGAGFETARITFPAGEAAKCFTRLERILEKLASAKLDRKSCVVALGGGVTGDLAGFAAATYMRGISFVQVPTSLLAQVDSSSGGKTGVNLQNGKNLAGAFHQPCLVMIDTRTLTTLPQEEFSCGMAEVVKHGMIRDDGYFALVEENADAIMSLEPDILQQVIAGSCRIKAEVVAADELEKGLRALLNFGHTFGHAYEQLSNFTLRHGEAVAMGMVAACREAEETRGLAPRVRERLQALLQRLGLPAEPPDFPAPAIRACMMGDKKTEHGRLRLVLPLRIGKADIFDCES